MQTMTTPANALQPPSLAESVPGRIALGLLATVVVALAAHVSFTLPFTAVPLTLQPLAVLGVGLAFGPAGGFLVMMAYLAEGAMGLPVFSPQGPGGVAQLAGLTGGFLMSYPLVALIAGSARSFRRTLPAFAAALITCTAAVILLFFCGAGWLLSLTHMPLKLALHQAVYPFLPGEAVKVLAASGIYSALTRTRNA